MVTLKFVFNKNKIALAGLTEDNLLHPMRIHEKKYNISEIETGVFSKDGKDAMCESTMFVTQMTNSNPYYINFLMNGLLMLMVKKKIVLRKLWNGLRSIDQNKYQ